MGSPPLHQIKTNTIEGDSQNRTKYAGIKLITSGGSSIKNREPGKYIEQNPLLNASGHYTQKGTPNSKGIKGYETLR